VEAPDEASHNADLDQKIRAIENFDRLIVGPVKKRLYEQSAFKIMVLPDHLTPIQLRTHTADPVPFSWCGHGIRRGEADVFSERVATRSNLQLEEGYQLMERLIKH
jgi:2,3-bisphosphoglycerate-independent phosphoglycerate mutase